MMINKEFTDAEIKAYVANLVEEAIAGNMKELSK